MLPFRRKYGSSLEIKEKDQLTLGQGRKKHGNNVLAPYGYMKGIIIIIIIIKTHYFHSQAAHRF